MSDATRIAVAGASGFVGRRLTQQLAAAGHQVVALGRTASNLPAGAGIEPTSVDVVDRTSMTRALRGCSAAYYLVHSMASEQEFEERDLKLARAFAAACAEADVERIIYLGGLGRGELSAHLRSRQEVGHALGAGGIPVVELRAAVVLGAGSVSYEMLRQLVERLPAMVCPRWVRTRISPVAFRDIVAYLEGALHVEPGIYEIGTDEPTTYRDLMGAYAHVRGLRARPIVNVPLLSLRLSSYWVDLITSVDHRVSHALIESLASEVVVMDPDRTAAAFGFRAMPVEDAIRSALAEESEEIGEELLGGGDDASGTVAPVLVDARRPVAMVRSSVPFDGASPDDLRRDLHAVGGAMAWYGSPILWRIRLVLGRILGEREGRVARAPELVPGASVDWWAVQRMNEDGIVLRARDWRVGDAWLSFSVDDDAARLVQAAAFRPRGLLGLLYWVLLRPIHTRVFEAMAQHRVLRVTGRRGRVPR